jgi:hypothetical protein
MTSPAGSQTTDRGRFYRFAGNEYVSVTTALSVISKPALVGWAAKKTAEAAVEHAESLPIRVKDDVSKLLDHLSNRHGVVPLERRLLGLLEAHTRAHNGEINWKHGTIGQDTLRLLKSHHRASKDDAADLGSILHGAFETIAGGYGVPDLPEGAQPYIEGFQLFWETVKPEPIRLESTIYNQEHGYAGTADLFAVIDGEICVADYKTGSSIWPEVALQLAAYANGEFIGSYRGQAEVQEPVPDAKKAYAIRIAPHSFNMVPVEIGRAVYESFVSALALWRWQQNSKSLLGEPVNGGAA